MTKFYGSQVLAKLRNRHRLVLKDFEDGHQLHQRQGAVALPGEAEELEGAALGADGLVFEGHHADAGAVDVGDPGEINQDLALALVQQVIDPPSKLQLTIVQGDLAFEREHDHVADLPLFDRQLRLAFRHAQPPDARNYAPPGSR